MRVFTRRVAALQSEGEHVQHSLRLLLPLLISVMVISALGAAAIRRAFGNSSRTPSLHQSLSAGPAGVTANYYVSPNGSDAGDGSLSRPWGTISHAAAHASPGTTIHVAPGLYLQAVETSVNGNALARVRFLSDVKWAAKIVVDGYTAWTNRGEYVDIEGFDIAGDGCIGINNESSHVRIGYNRVHDIPALSSLCGNDGGAGIADSNYTGTDDNVIGNVVYDIGSHEHPNQLVHGIYHSNRGGRIVNNLVCRVAAWGITTWHAAREVIIVNNTVVNNGAGGIMVGAGDAPGGIVNDYTRVSNNVAAYNVSGCCSNAGYGIQERGATGSHNRYFNNLVYQNQAGTIQFQNGLAATGTINANPEFVNYTGDCSGDYHLRPSSPAVGAGSTTDAPADDLDGRTRPVNGSWDIGAYESSAATGITGPHKERTARP